MYIYKAWLRRLVDRRSRRRAAPSPPCSCIYVYVYMCVGIYTRAHAYTHTHVCVFVCINGARTRHKAPLHATSPLLGFRV